MSGVTCDLSHTSILAPQAHISLMPQMELGGLAQGLEKLEEDYHGVADADMDAMFAQVSKCVELILKHSITIGNIRTWPNLTIHTLTGPCGGAYWRQGRPRGHRGSGEEGVGRQGGSDRRGGK